MFSVESIVYAWDNQLRYALALLEDVTDEQMVLRPGGNMNHPAWILGHVMLYHPIVPRLLAKTCSSSRRAFNATSTSSMIGSLSACSANVSSFVPSIVCFSR